jgi:hypothetical protein
LKGGVCPSPLASTLRPRTVEGTLDRKVILLAVGILVPVLGLSAWFVTDSLRGTTTAEVLAGLKAFHGKQVTLSGTAHDVTRMPFTGKNIFLLRDATGEMFVISTLDPPEERAEVRVVGVVSRGIQIPILNRNVGTHVEAERLTSRPPKD